MYFIMNILYTGWIHHQATIHINTHITEYYCNILNPGILTSTVRGNLTTCLLVIDFPILIHCPGSLDDTTVSLHTKSFPARHYNAELGKILYVGCQLYPILTADISSYVSQCNESPVSCVRSATHCVYPLCVLGRFRLVLLGAASQSGGWGNNDPVWPSSPPQWTLEPHWPT